MKTERQGKKMTNKQVVALLQEVLNIYSKTKTDEEFEEAITKLQENIEKGVTANADQAKR